MRLLFGWIASDLLLIICYICIGVLRADNIKLARKKSKSPSAALVPELKTHIKNYVSGTGTQGALSSSDQLEASISTLPEATATSEETTWIATNESERQFSYVVLSGHGGHQFFCRARHSNGLKTTLVFHEKDKPICYFNVPRRLSVKDAEEHCTQSFGGTLLFFESMGEYKNLIKSGILDADEEYALQPIAPDGTFGFKSEQFEEGAGTNVTGAACLVVQNGKISQVDCMKERHVIVCMAEETSWKALKSGDYEVVSDCPEIKADMGVIKSTLVHRNSDDSWFCIIFYEHLMSEGSYSRVTDFCLSNFGAVPFYVSSSNEDELLRSLMPWQYYTILMSLQLSPGQVNFPDGTSAFYVRWRVYSDDDTKTDGECIYMRSDPERDSFIAADCPVSPRQRKTLICRKNITAGIVKKYSSVPEPPHSNATYGEVFNLQQQCPLTRRLVTELVNGACGADQGISTQFKPVMISVNSGQKYYCLYDFSFFASGGLDIHDAEDFCVTIVHGHLFSIIDENELKFVHDLLFPKGFRYHKFLLETRLLGVEFVGEGSRFYDGTDSSYAAFMANYSAYYHSPSGNCAISVRTREGDYIWPANCEAKHYYHTCKVYVDSPRFVTVTSPGAEPVAKERWSIIIAALTLFGLVNLCICVFLMEGRVVMEPKEVKEEGKTEPKTSEAIEEKPKEPEVTVPLKPFVQSMPFSYLAGVKSAVDLRRRNMPEETVVESSDTTETSDTKKEERSESPGMLITPRPSRGIRTARAPKTFKRQSTSPEESATSDTKKEEPSELMSIPEVEEIPEEEVIETVEVKPPSMKEDASETSSLLSAHNYYVGETKVEFASLMSRDSEASPKANDPESNVAKAETLTAKDPESIKEEKKETT